MAKTDFDVIVIGGGSGGLVSAVGCAGFGMKTLLVEKEHLGGDCLYYGCVPSKTLLKSAAVYHAAGEAARFGLPAMERPPVSMAEITNRVQKVIADIAVHDSPEAFRERGVHVEIGSSKFVGEREIELNGRVLSAKSFVLATGSRPRSLPIPGLEEAGYLTNIDIFSLTELPARVVTIGAGPIGIEMSQALSRLGAKVTVLDIAPQILPREDADMAAVVRARLDGEGLFFALGVKVLRVEKDGAAKRVVIEEDGGEKSIEADAIIMAAGRAGNTDDLDLEKAGVTVEKSFVPVDAGLKTSNKHILGVGDVNGRYLFTHVAAAEASVAVRRLAFHLPAKMSYTNVPWVTYTDPELASVGYNEMAAKEAGILYTVEKQSYDANDRARAEGEAEGLVKVLLDKKGRVIGSQIAGYHAGDVLLPATYAVTGKWKIKGLLDPIIAYPTLGELPKKVASGYYGPRLFNDKVRKLLRFFFRHRGTGAPVQDDGAGSPHGGGGESTHGGADAATKV